MKFILDQGIFGKLLPYIEEEEITDINWNGKNLWVNHLQKGRYCIPDFVLERHFIEQFTQILANLVNVSFNAVNPVLEAETDDLRISILHEEIVLSGRSISIRKTPAVMRLNKKKMEEENYCTNEISTFLENCVKAKLNTIICGLPGAGKTELLKGLTHYINPNQRVITIEDCAEIHYCKINPNKDCIELKVCADIFSYTDAIKACLRQLPEWILLSEARSIEVKSLLESMSTGTHCITTLHTDDVRKIPDRIINMMPEYKENVMNDIFNFLDVGILVRSGVKDTGIHRSIAQISIFSRNEGGNETFLLFHDGKMAVTELKQLPQDIRFKFELMGIKNPFIMGGGE